MAIQTFTAAPTNSTDATFRAWGSAVSAALAAIGLVKTANTGQIDWTTATKPAALNTLAGYEVWRFNDTLQTAAPIYIRLWYGSSTSNQLDPSIQITIATGTDGASGMTGSVSDASLIMKTSGNETNLLNCYVSGDSGRMSMELFADSATHTTAVMFASVERVRDTSGAPSVDGAVLLTYTAGAAPTEYLLWAAGGSPTKETSSWPFLLPNSTNSASWGGDVTVSPVYTCWGKVLPPGLSWMIHKKADFVLNELFVTSLYGVSHTYRSCGSTNSGASFYPSGYLGSPTIAMLWE